MTPGLIHGEEGRISPTDFRRCDREITVPFDVPPMEVDEPLVYLVAHKRVPAAGPLPLRINGEVYAIDGAPSSMAQWFRCGVRPRCIRSGQNSIQILPQPGWRIPFEQASGHPIVRLRVSHPAAGNEPVLPDYGDPLIERQRQEWLALLPETLRTIGPRCEWCWQLAGFLSQAWRYRNGRDGVSYAPWDARTILRWGRRGTDEDGQPVIAMCVHYAVCFVQFCIAMGVPSRAVVLTSDLNSPDGHFVAEVWLDEFQRWAMIDPNLHLCYRDSKGGRPLSVAELAAYGPDLHRLARFGEGFESQRQRLGAFAQNHCLSGKVYRLWGVWRRHDWAARPDLAPLAHGCNPYTETDIVWCADNQQARSELGMFPDLLTSKHLSRPPSRKLDSDAAHVSR